MRKEAPVVLLLVVLLLLSACAKTAEENQNAVPPQHEVSYGPISEDTMTEPTAATVPETVYKETEATLPLHSELYRPEYTVQQVLEYFEEVVLHMEYSDGTGNTSLVQKWLAPIYYRIYGDPTEEDRAILLALFAQLNEIEGFPGIYPAEGEETENISIRFLEPEIFRAVFSPILNGEEAFGATHFWFYTDTNELHTANIGYRIETDQKTRASILLEEVINTLGISDTVLRTDSIVYQYSDENTALSDMDWLILQLLYNPAIQCGMDMDGCTAVIQELYY